jgi:hypothetical protein
VFLAQVVSAAGRISFLNAAILYSFLGDMIIDLTSSSYF